MKTDQKQLFYWILGLVGVILAYLNRGILMPFFLAAIFAYLLNPAVSFLNHHFKLPRTLAIALIYVVIIGLLSVLAINIGIQLSRESQEFTSEANNLVRQTNSQISVLPTWLQPVAVDTFDSLRSSLLLTNRRPMTYLPGALNRSVSVLIFLVAAFYFLKDGSQFIKNSLNFFGEKNRREIELVIQKINQVLGNYLRGQLFLILIMSSLTYIGLLIIGVKYALIISIFTGFAEIVPFAGPVVAASVAVIVAFTDQFSRISPAMPLLDVLAVISLYTVLRQVEDLFIIPQVMGRLTKLHPLIILFSVLAGGQIFGIVGYVVAVPIVASAKVIIDHVLETTKKAP